jgi:hypothetical protein
MERNKLCFNHEKEILFVHEKKSLEPYREKNSIPNKTKPIQIQKVTNHQLTEYSLSNHFFDPAKSSPPNDFLLKLYARIDKYQKKEANLCSEY